jgi:TATA-box binding protein (TBP) (component of TFIID and TFIIIB)
MVVLYKTNLKFDTTKLAECLPLNEEIVRIEKKGIVKRGESNRDKIKHRKKKEEKPVNNTGFGHNSITLVIMNDGFGELTRKEITIKIFQNGVFHLTGVLDERYDRDSMNRLIDILKTCKESWKEDIDTVEILDRRVVLMNYTSEIVPNQTIPREALHTAIRNAKLDNIVSYYDPDVYPGVKIHIGENKWTAKVFRTGKIILTGVKSEDECRQLLNQLITLLENVLPKKIIQL